MAEISGAIGAVSINLNDLDQHQQMGARPLDLHLHFIKRNLKSNLTAMIKLPETCGVRRVGWNIITGLTMSRQEVHL